MPTRRNRSRQEPPRSEQGSLVVRRVRLNDIHADPANVRKHGERNLQSIRDSLRTFGQVEPLVVQKGTGKVIGGNGRLEVMRAEGVLECDIVEVEADNVRAAALAITLNRTSELAEWDDPALAETLRALQSEPDFDLAAVGFTAEEIDGLCAGLGNKILGDPAEVPEPQTDRADELREKWGVEPGQLWVIPSLATPGKEHRLLCGDSTKAEDVARVMGGEKAALCLTDPPYGIGETYDTHDDTPEALRRIIGDFLPLARSAANVVLLTPGNGNLFSYPRPEWVLAWACPAGTGSGPWGFCCWQPMLAYGKDPYLASGMGRRPDFLNRTESADNEISHPCPKPMGVWKWAIERGSATKGDSVFDPFAGSGTTLCAAEQTGRLAFGIEIAPKYVAVALERLAGMGLAPVLR